MMAEEKEAKKKFKQPEAATIKNSPLEEKNGKKKIQHHHQEKNVETVHIKLQTPQQLRKEILKTTILTIELLKKGQTVTELSKLKRKATTQLRRNLQELKELSIKLDLTKFPEIPAQINIPERRVTPETTKIQLKERKGFLKRRTELEKLDEEIGNLKERIMGL